MSKITINIEYSYEDITTRIIKGPIVINIPSKNPSSTIAKAIQKAVYNICTIDITYCANATNLAMYIIEADKEYIAYDTSKLSINLIPGTIYNSFQNNWVVIPAEAITGFALKSTTNTIAIQNQNKTSQNMANNEYEQISN